MKVALLISLFIIFVFKLFHINKEILSKDNKETCFSKSNFDTVYKFIDTKIKNEIAFYEFENYTICLKNNTEIWFLKKGYSKGKITKEKGVFSLAIWQKDNDRIVKEINELFCKILSETKNDK